MRWTLSLTHRLFSVVPSNAHQVDDRRRGVHDVVQPPFGRVQRFLGFAALATDAQLPQLAFDRGARRRRFPLIT